MTDLQPLADRLEEHQKAGQPHEPGRDREAQVSCIDLAQSAVWRRRLSPPERVVISAYNGRGQHAQQQDGPRC